nr:hypothetical protein [Tanacetum cinerariifolium]
MLFHYKAGLSQVEGILEFADDTVTNYSRPSPTIESTSDDAQNRNSFVLEIEASPSTILFKPFIKFVKAADPPTVAKSDKKETVRKPSVKYAEQYRKPSKTSNVRGNQRNWNNLKSQQGEKGRTCPTNTHKSTLPRPAVHKTHRPQMRPIRPNVNAAQPKRTSFHKPAHSYNKRPFQRTSALKSQFRDPRVATVNRKFPTVNRKLPTINRKFPTINRKLPTVNRKFSTGNTKFSTADMGNKGKVIKASACWFWKPSHNLSNKGPNSNSGNSQNRIDDKGYWDSGCSRHMTCNISYLSDYEPFDGG